MQFEGVHREIALRGIERAGQDTMITDGAMNEVIGLDMRDGSYVPYAPSSENVSLPKDTIVVRWHHTSTGNNLIAVDNNLSLFFKKENNEAWQYVCQLPSAEIAFLGNAICTTESGFYLLWKDSQYRIIEKSNYPRVFLRTNDDTGSAGQFYIPGSESGGYTDETRYTELSYRCDKAGYLHQMHLCRYAVQLTNGSYCYVSNPFLIQHPYAMVNRAIIRNGGTSTSIGNSYYEDGVLRGTQLQFRLEEDYTQEEVLRVSIFLTKGFDMFNAVRITNNHASWDEEYYRGVINSLQDDDVYYKVYDIYPQDLKASADWHNINLAGKLRENLYTAGNILPLMATTTYNAEHLFIYNKRLHMINIKNKIDANYRLEDFFYRNSGAKDFVDEQVVVSSSGIQDLGNLTSIRVNGRGFSIYDITSGRFDLNSTARGDITFYFEDGTSYHTTIQIPYGSAGRSYLDILNELTGGTILRSPYRITIWYKNDAGEELVSVNEGYYFCSTLHKLNPYLAVSHRGATRIVLDIQFDGTNYRVDKVLKPSVTQNVAFYLDEDFMPISWEVNSGTFMRDGERNSDEITHMAVSETGMPSVFNLETYRIGIGQKLVGVSFFSLDVTNQNFGRYPLVVFGTDGVYLMSINESGSYAYTSTNKIAEDVCTNAGMICRTNHGILFSAEKGLLMLTNNGVEEAIHHIIGEPSHKARIDVNFGKGLNVYHCAVVGHDNQYKITDMLNELSIEDVRVLIQDNCFMEYDTHIGKLVIWSPKVDYVYMIDTANGLVEKIGAVIKISDKEGGYYGSIN